jgi:hypothetical protein
MSLVAMALDEGVLVKAGKFVEAVAKALMIHGGKALPPARKFKAGVELRLLEQLTSALFSLMENRLPTRAQMIGSLLGDVDPIVLLRLGGIKAIELHTEQSFRGHTIPMIFNFCKHNFFL